MHRENKDVLDICISVHGQVRTENWSKLVISNTTDSTLVITAVVT